MRGAEAVLSATPIPTFPVWRTPCLAFCRNDDLATAELLLRLGADINLRSHGPADVDLQESPMAWSRRAKSRRPEPVHQSTALMEARRF